MLSQLFSLQHAAELVRVRPTTVAYWARTFPTLLSTHATAQQPPRFTPQDIEALARIRELALDLGFSSAAIINRLSTPKPPPAPERLGPLEKLVEEVQSLREEITFLAEESKELHRMLALLLQLAWQTGSSDPSVSQASQNEESSRPHPSAHNGTTPGRAGSSIVVSGGHTVAQEGGSPWTPPPLG